MPNVAIQPCADPAAQAHFANTIAKPVPIARILPHLSADDGARLRSLYPEGQIPVWGATAGKNDANVPQWRKLDEGDLVLFMAKKRAFTSGVVTHKVRASALARELWTLKDGAPFEYVFFLRDIREEDIPYGVIRRAAGLSENWNPLKFWVIDGERKDRIFDAVEEARNGNEPATSGARSADAALALVRTPGDVRRAVVTFNVEAGPEEASLLRATTYWVHDPLINSFAPSKFAGIRDISLDQYADAQAAALAAGRLAGFDGHQSRVAIERAVGAAFEPSSTLSQRLSAWAQELSESMSIFDGVDTGKWMFVSLPLDRPARVAPVRTVHPTDEHRLHAALTAAREAGAFEVPPTEQDARTRVLVDIVRRRGQPRFRRMLLAAYGGRCSISGCEVEEALEAAHIVAYRGVSTNHPANGLPLRSDLHTLFDLGLVSIDPDSLTIRVSAQIRASGYGVYHGKALTLPADPMLHPSRDALRRRQAAHAAR